MAAQCSGCHNLGQYGLMTQEPQEQLRLVPHRGVCLGMGQDGGFFVGWASLPGRGEQEAVTSGEHILIPLLLERPCLGTPSKTESKNCNISIFLAEALLYLLECLQRSVESYLPTP